MDLSNTLPDRFKVKPVRKIGEFPSELVECSIVQFPSKIYVLGGFDGSDASNTIYKADIKTDGSLGDFILIGKLPRRVYGASLVVTSTKVHLLGGFDCFDCSDDIITADISENYTLGKFTVSGKLPFSLCGISSAVVNNKVYMFGGNDGGKATSGIFSSTITENNTLGEFVFEGNLPQPLDTCVSITKESSIYLVGGRNEETFFTSNIYKVDIQENGNLGSFTLAGKLPYNLVGYSVLIKQNKLYIINGLIAVSDVLISEEATSLIYVADICEDGTISDFITYSEANATTVLNPVVITSLGIYIIGGVKHKWIGGDIHLAEFCN